MSAAIESTSQTHTGGQTEQVTGVHCSSVGTYRPPILRALIVFARNLVFLRRNLALLRIRLFHSIVIKTPKFGIQNLIFYPFSVKIML